MSQENTKVHYTGKVPIEISVGEFRRKFRPDETSEIADVRFRNELLSHADFSVAADGTKATTPKASAPKTEAAENQTKGEVK